MLGEPINNCHMRVPVSSNPKYCSVSRFSKTDSRSRTRTRTWAGVAARSANETIGTTPPSEPGAQFDCAREEILSIAFYRGLRGFPIYLMTGRNAAADVSAKMHLLVFEQKTG